MKQKFKILIDNSNLMAGGGIQVATSFIYDLVKIGGEHIFHVVQSPNSAKQIKEIDFPSNFVFYTLSEEDFYSKRKRIKFAQNIENSIQPNAIFTVFGPSYYKSKCPKIVGFAIPFIIYPQSPYFGLISFAQRIKFKALSILKSYLFNKNSDTLIFESEYAKEYYQKQYHFKGDTYTVHNTLNQIFLNKQSWEDFNVENTADFNVLLLSANYPHKNVQIVPEIIKILKLKGIYNIKFHISASKEEFNFDDVYDNYINYLGHIDLVKLPSLYQQMDCLLMPTLLEVFSTTYLEAMYMKLPILASDMNFSRYICKEAALYSSPLLADEYAEKLVLLHENKNLPTDLINKGIENLQRFNTSLERSKMYLKIIEKNINK